MFAPEDMATYVHPSILFSLIYFTIPAIARAPAGSRTHLVSLNPILMAAQISSSKRKKEDKRENVVFE